MSNEWKVVGEKKPKKKKSPKKPVKKPAPKSSFLTLEEEKIIAHLSQQNQQAQQAMKGRNPEGIYFTSSVYVMGPPSKTIVHEPKRIL